MLTKTTQKTNFFVIKHYAAEVTYQITNFIHKNQDPFHQDLATCLRNSSSTFIQEVNIDIIFCHSK